MSAGQGALRVGRKMGNELPLIFCYMTQWASCLLCEEGIRDLPYSIMVFPSGLVHTGVKDKAFMWSSNWSIRVTMTKSTINNMVLKLGYKPYSVGNEGGRVAENFFMILGSWKTKEEGMGRLKCVQVYDNSLSKWFLCLGQQPSWVDDTSYIMLLTT